MVKRVTHLLSLFGLILVACVSSEAGETVAMPDGNRPASAAVREAAPASDPLAESTPPTNVASPIIVKADKGLYRQGESIVVTIENSADRPIQFTENCSLNVCFESGEDWFCEERECDGPMTVLEPGGHLGLLREAKSIHPATAADSATQYKLDYQFVSEEPYYFAYSDEFTVQGAGMNCKQARQIALAQAQSSPDWHNIDTARAIVRWQDENQTCRVDFAWHGAAEIRIDLWSDGYYVVVSPRFGQVIEANAYER